MQGNRWNCICHTNNEYTKYWSSIVRRTSTSILRFSIYKQSDIASLLSIRINGAKTFINWTHSGCKISVGSFKIHSKIVDFTLYPSSNGLSVSMLKSFWFSVGGEKTSIIISFVVASQIPDEAQYLMILHDEFVVPSKTNRWSTWFEIVDDRNDKGFQ